MPQSEVSEVETFSFALGGEEISIAPAAAAAVSDYINPTVRYINVVPTRFSPGTVLGNFAEMMTRPEYDAMHFNNRFGSRGEPDFLAYGVAWM